MIAIASLLVSGAWTCVSGPGQLVAHPPVERPRDPWVFRSVLDERPRMVTVALHEGLWAAYDTSTCSLYGVWAGGVEFEGAVYDTTHGPQPRTSEAFLLGPESGPGPAPTGSWRAVRAADGEELELRPRYRGYRFFHDEEGGEQVRFHWEFELPGAVTVDVREHPNGVSNPGRTSDHPVLAYRWLARSFEVSGLPEGIELQVPSGVWFAGEDAWTGKASTVSGHADGICEWEGVEGDNGWPYLSTLEDQRERLAAHARRIEGWRAAGREWRPSWLTLLGNGSGFVYMELRPVALAPEEDESGEGER